MIYILGVDAGGTKTTARIADSKGNTISESISGSGSFTRYWVDNSLPQDFMEELPGKIARYAFKSLEENSFEERSIGWVNIMDILDNRFNAMEYLKEPFLAMSFRADKRKVPQTALKQYCQEAEEKIMELDK